MANVGCSKPPPAPASIAARKLPHNAKTGPACSAGSQSLLSLKLCGKISSRDLELAYKTFSICILPGLQWSILLHQSWDHTTLYSWFSEPIIHHACPGSPCLQSSVDLMNDEPHLCHQFMRGAGVRKWCRTSVTRCDMGHDGGTWPGSLQLASWSAIMAADYHITWPPQLPPVPGNTGNISQCQCSHFFWGDNGPILPGTSAIKINPLLAGVGELPRH